jgi:predicted GNAT family acetyltransferase
MVTGDPPIRVVDAPGARRYEAHLEESLAGFADYRLTPGRITFIHTEVDPAFEGRRIGSALVEGALADARARGLSVIPICPFFKAYIRRHPEIADVVLPGAGD